MKYLSLFSGIGGFEKGIQQSKHNLECIGYSEIDKYAKKVYKKHFPNHTDWGDVTKIKTNELPEFELLVGGFPCQAFSTAGKQGGFNDTRGTLFFEIARILKDKKPKYFLLENVRGLLSHDKGRTFQTILKVLSEIGYNVQWQVYNSKNFGVPQNRERIYIKGYSRTQCRGEVLSFTITNGEVDGSLNYTRDKHRPYTTNEGVDGILGTLTCDGQNSGGRQLIKLNDKSQGQSIYDSNGLSCTLSANGGGQGGKTGLYCVNDSKLEVGGNYGDTNHGGKNVYSSDGLHPTLIAGAYKRPTYIEIQNNTKKGYIEATDGDGINIERPNCKTRRGRVQKDSVGTLSTECNWGVNESMKIRRLTPLECERLQGFPDEWTKYGFDRELLSDTQRYKMCGNAVTVNVVEFIMDNWDLKMR